MGNAGTKRILIRVSVVSGVIVAGLIAIASAQRLSRNKAIKPTADAVNTKAVAVSAANADPAEAVSEDTAALLAAAERESGASARRGAFDDPFQTAAAPAAPPPADDRYAEFYVAANGAQDAAVAVVEDTSAAVNESFEALAPVAATQEETPTSDGAAFRESEVGGETVASAESDATEQRQAAVAPVADDRYTEWRRDEGASAAEQQAAPLPNDRQPFAESTPATNNQEFAAIDQRPTSAALNHDAGAPLEATESLPPRHGREEPSAAAESVEQDSIGPSESMAVRNRNAAARESAERPRAERLQSAALGEGLPGDPKLESEQGAALVIHKTGPAEVQLGLETTYEIRVQNVGDAPAHDVEIHDVAPRGAELVATQPQIAPGANGELVWALGTLAPGEDVAVQMRVTPRAEGEMGSVARVFFSADAAVRTLVTRPQLELSVEAPKSVLAGERAQIFVRITNTGTGVATGVVLEEIVPAGFEHPAGASLEYRVGTLKPRDSKELPLTLAAVTPTESTNVVSARADGNILVEQRTALAVVAPALQVEMQGPRRRFLDRDATYTVAVSNPGTAPAREIELVTFLSPGMEFVSADSSGQYDPQTRAVYWLLDELPPNEMGNVTVTARPTQPGEHVLRVEGRAQRGLEDIEEQPILVEGLAAVEFQVVDLSDPVEVEGEAAYEIVVKNGGTKAAADVEIVAMLPVEMQLVAAEGPTGHKMAGQKVVFEPIASLAPGKSVTYQLTAKTLEAGDARLQVKLLTAEMQSPVTKEENTKIFGDE